MNILFVKCKLKGESQMCNGYRTSEERWGHHLRYISSRDDIEDAERDAQWSSEQSGGTTRVLDSSGNILARYVNGKRKD